MQSIVALILIADNGKYNTITKISRIGSIVNKHSPGQPARISQNPIALYCLYHFHFILLNQMFKLQFKIMDFNRKLGLIDTIIQNHKYHDNSEQNGAQLRKKNGTDIIIDTSFLNISIFLATKKKSISLEGRPLVISVVISQKLLQPPLVSFLSIIIFISMKSLSSGVKHPFFTTDIF